MSRPSSTITPLVGRSNPAMQRKRVVLPHPDGPTTATNSDVDTLSDTSRTAFTGPNTLPSALIESMPSVRAVRGLLLASDGESHEVDQRLLRRSCREGGEVGACLLSVCRGLFHGVCDSPVRLNEFRHRRSGA